MKTSTYDPHRRFSVDRLRDVGKLVTTDLKLKAVEDRMVDNRQYMSDHILSTLQQCILQKDDVDTSNLSEEDKAEVEAEEGIEQDDFPDAADEDETVLSNANVELEEETNADEADANADRGFNVNCAIDVWHKGMVLLNSDGIKVRRESQRERDDREKKMMDVIGQIIQDAQSSRRETRLIPEPEHVEETDWMLQCQEMSRFN